jgi:hypothetical protein
MATTALLFITIIVLLEAMATSLHALLRRVSVNRCVPLHAERYLVEFRGIHPTFRLHEFDDAFRHICGASSGQNAPLTFSTLIPDLLVPSAPACAYVDLPDDRTARDIARRCTLVRSVVKVWGQGNTADITAAEAAQNYDALVAPFFPADRPRAENSWKVSFRRYGRGGKSGLDPSGKWDLLQRFAPVLLRLPGDVR